MILDCIISFFFLVLHAMTGMSRDMGLGISPASRHMANCSAIYERDANSRHRNPCGTVIRSMLCHYMASASHMFMQMTNIVIAGQALSLHALMFAPEQLTSHTAKLLRSKIC